MITVITPVFPDLITSESLAMIYFSKPPNLITNEGDTVKINIVATIPMEDLLGMRTYHESFIVVTLSGALWCKLKMISCPYMLNIQLCWELKKQELAEEKAAQKRAEAAQKRAKAAQKRAEAAQKRAEAAQKRAEAAQKKKEAALKKKEADEKRCQEKQNAQNALKKQREDEKKKSLQEKQNLRKKAHGIKKKTMSCLNVTSVFNAASSLKD
jgi:hypothetical protein